LEKKDKGGETEKRDIGETEGGLKVKDRGKIQE
jgi:hypothetical protein